MLQAESDAFQDIQGIVLVELVDDDESPVDKTSASPTLATTAAPSTVAPSTTKPVTLAPTATLSTLAPTTPAVAVDTASMTPSLAGAVDTTSMTPSALASMTFPSTVAPTTTAQSLSYSAWGSFDLLETVPHDAGAFTQGLELVPGNSIEYYESTGNYGTSTIRRVDIATGQLIQVQPLPSTYFGEGLTFYLDENGNRRLIQLTWRAGMIIRYDADSLAVVEERSVDSTTNGEGWGICHVASDNIFYVTDGTQYLHKWDVSTLELLGKVAVTMRESPDAGLQELYQLNELEWDYHSGTVLSNVWTSTYIVRIDPATGFVTRRYDLSSLVTMNPAANVLNGIAVTSVPNEVWVTGKLWPNMYRIRLND